MYVCRMKRPRWILGLLVLSMLLPGCGKQMPDEYKQLDKETRQLRMYANTFAWNEMNFYYLWKAEVASAMEKWQNWEEPIAKVAAIRYKDVRGEDIDRWTMLTDDFSSFTGSVSGHTRTLGLDYRLYYFDEARTRVCAVVTFAYEGSPAAEAGIGRGAVILKVDGREMTPDNYRELVRNGLLGGGTVTLGFSDGRSVTLTAVDMYENPVHTVRILEREDGRKVGYLHYASFTLDSCQDLVDAFKRFTDEGIDELVLDLRYNGGGYVLAETVLASMLAPVAAVEGKRVFSREVFNETLTEEVGKDSTCFGTGFTYRSGGELQVISTARANPDLRRLFVLTTEGSASASESLICGLKPYMDVVVVGARTSGKYCAGLLLPASNWVDEVKDALEDGEYEVAKPLLANWGLYVMYSRYADCNGRTLSMPDGIAPDHEVADKPGDGFDLGDPHETMLAAALSLIEDGSVGGRTRSASEPVLTPVPDAPRRPGFGLLVKELPR